MSWEMVKLEKIKAPQRYSLVGGPFGSNLVTRDYVEQGVPVIRGTNLSGDFRFSLDDLVFVSDEKADELLPNNAYPGDVVFTQRGTLGQIGIIPKNCGYERFVISQSQMKLTVDENQAEPFFVYYFFKSAETVQKILNLALSSGVPHINLQILREFEIPLPPVPTQRRIADILSAYDDLIENNTRRIRILEQMAQALYQEWFVNFRYPGHENIKLIETKLGTAPKNWEVVSLESVCSKITDGSHYSPPSIISSGYPMASVKDMTDWDIDLDSCRRISEDEYLKLVKNDCKPQQGDVLVAKDGSYLKHIFVVQKERELVLLSSIAILRPNEKIFPYILSMYLRTPFVTTRMAGYVSGVAIPRIVLKDFRQFPVLLPPKEVQEKFNKIIEPIMKTIFLLVEKNTNLRQTRDLLLPRLVSGEVEVWL